MADENLDDMREAVRRAAKEFLALMEEGTRIQSDYLAKIIDAGQESARMEEREEIIKAIHDQYAKVEDGKTDYFVGYKRALRHVQDAIREREAGGCR